MGRAIVAVVAGVVTAFLVILAVEFVGHLVVPVPGAPSINDAARMRDYLATLPVSAYAFVLLAYFAGCLVGGRVAARVAPASGRTVAVVTGVLVFAATIANLMMIAHPTWFVVACIVVIAVSTAVAMATAPRRVAATNP